MALITTTDTERSHLLNGRFLHSIDEWTASSATYSAGDGDAHYGVAVLAAGGSIVQTCTVDYARAYTLALAVKGGDATIAIEDGDGNALPVLTAEGEAGVWTISTFSIGLAPDTIYTLTISNGGGSAISVDDVSLWWLPITRMQLAVKVARKIATLAADAELTTAPNDEGSEGHYTDAVDTGLRNLGAIDPATDTPDVRWLTAAQVSAAVTAIEGEMLERLQRHYATLTDIQVGERNEKYSQIEAAITRLIAANVAESSSAVASSSVAVGSVSIAVMPVW